MRAVRARNHGRRALAGLAVTTLVLAAAGTPAQADDNPVQKLAAKILAAAEPGEALRVVVTSRAADGRPSVVTTTAPNRTKALQLISGGLASPSTIGVDIAHTVHIAANSNDTYRSSQWALTRFKAE